MTPEQEKALRRLCTNYKVDFDRNAYHWTFDLPEGYVAGWVGPIYVGCDRDGRISS